MGFFDLGNNEKKDKGFSLFSFLENNQENDDNQDLDKFGLNSWQKDEVKKKNYSLWNFEE